MGWLLGFLKRHQRFIGIQIEARRVVGEDVGVALDLFGLGDFVALDGQCFESLLFLVVGLVVEDEPLEDLKVGEGVKDLKNLFVDLFGPVLEEREEGFHLKAGDHFVEVLNRVERVPFRCVFQFSFDSS